MSQAPVNCPRCESEQPFVPQVRPSSRGQWQETYIRCHMCRYEQVLRYTTPEIERTRKLLRKFEGTRAGKTNAGISVPASAHKNEARTRTQLALLMSQLEIEVRRGQATDTDTA